MEDSGIESDSKILQRNGTEEDEVVIVNGSKESASEKLMKKVSEIHKKIDRKSGNPEQSRKGLLNRNRLPVPSRKGHTLSPSDTEPLVIIETDDSEDEFAVPRLSKHAHKEITQQLIKDGYNLDLEPDDEDLDLIPPRPIHERCICCNMQVNCTIL